ncbi:VOC family protein [Spongiimicrobium salis]|uniref:VOC family protein n=1 Tax=Spongiimicrobium salis TaxID=1667022 RepID=UPI00374D5C32
MQQRQLDHIVYSVFDLDKAIEDFEALLGVRPIFSGHHSSFGTKNALINLTDGAYLELLAIDTANTAVLPPRWMGIDLLSKPCISRWALKTTAIEKDSRILQRHDEKMGQLVGGSRNTEKGKLLQWDLTLPLAAPEVELVPFSIDWSKSETHPTQELPDMGCKLIKITATHPYPETYTSIFEQLDYHLTIEKAATVQLKMTLESPLGIIEL